MQKRIIQSNPTCSKEIAKKVKEVINTLNAIENTDGICSQYGLYYCCEKESIKISECAGNLLIRIATYKDSFEKVPETEEVYLKGHRASTHMDRIQKICQVLNSKVIRYSDGKTGDNEVTIVFEAPCPKSLLCAIKNTKNISGGYQMTEEEQKRLDDFYTSAKIPIDK
jgi:hypothetical protein